MDDAGLNCLAIVEGVVRKELSKGRPDVARVSLYIGLCEAALTAADTSSRGWPVALSSEAEAGLRLLDDFVLSLDGKTRSCAGTREKLKLISDSVWSNLSSTFTKEVLHAQHVSSFCNILASAGQKGGKRQLDCAGVVTTVLAIAHRLASLSECHADLATVYIQVSEDHCWLTLSDKGWREESVEISTASKAKRASVVEAQAWDGWLYSGGHATVCSSGSSILSALLVSMNTVIGNRSTNSAEESTELEAIQRLLLRVVVESCPTAFGSRYPMASPTLARLMEAEETIALLRAVEAGEGSGYLLELLRLESAAEAQYRSAAPNVGEENGGHVSPPPCWYPFSSLFGYHKARGDMIADCLVALGESRFELACKEYDEAFRTFARGGHLVLRRYRFCKSDEQLWKDVYCVLQHMEDVMQWRRQVSGAELKQAELLQCLLQLWDGVCHLFSLAAVPRQWVDITLRCAKLFCPDTRTEAAAAAQVSSPAMKRCQGLWGGPSLRAPPLRAIFESPVVPNDHESGSGRRKRTRLGSGSEQ